MVSDIEISQRAKMRHIIDLIKSEYGLPEEDIEQYGKYKAKLPLDLHKKFKNRPDGKLILVTAISPTPAGEGKTTTSIGLSDALNLIGKKCTVVLREPSLGPVFGMKGGAAGGGYSQVVPMEDINLHFTGDFAAVALAHNLLSALIDNHIHHGNTLNLDSRRINWKRVVDMNDRALRDIAIGLGGVANGYLRQDSFDIVVASEIMAILCLADSIADLKARISNITIGYTRDKRRVTVAELGAQGAMTALLKDAIKPNIVQTLENNPAIIHGGPFANIAHGCNSLIATKTALKLSDYVVTEAGFGADLGAEKFINIKCRKSGLKLSAIVIVATIRALKYHGGVNVGDLQKENLGALKTGFRNLQRHLDNINEEYGFSPIVALNHFTFDSEDELALLQEMVTSNSAEMVICKHWSDGSRGAVDLAKKVVNMIDYKKPSIKFVYDEKLTIKEKIEAVARKVYGAGKVNIPNKVMVKIEEWGKDFGHYPICIAKTQYSFTNDPTLRGLPNDGYNFEVSDVKLNSGAEFIVVFSSSVMTMPGLPKIPAANHIDINANGEISGLF